ncbi:DUF423 domain-containing protein [Thiomicrospira microaerophila]|uniref:DUF423 domain-containing protein n=1 Tax=Thiomicrospira microaerophila TaxID=406020 RepID=UPI00200FE0E5|nr:DUF423 domain-containing protein [Thiomicrospira microaerophila]UQB42963.1 DUF423 domain-containing protein [Thiomicrospira microaerophila]
MKINYWLSLSACLMMLAVMLGAFGAHGLESQLTEKQLSTWQTAVFYHFAHAIALLTLSLAGLIHKPLRFTGIKTGLLVGILLFSGSLYLWVLLGWQPLVYLTPIGGTIWVFSWLMLSYQAWLLKPNT